MHAGPEVLFLPNAWDAASSKVFETEGFRAIGTTSAGIAAVLGYADGQNMSLADNLAIAGCIVRSTSLPVSVDIEAGYGAFTTELANAAARVLDIGAVGLNLEDSTGDKRKPLFELGLQQEKIRAMREMSAQRGIHLVINARTDTCLVEDDIDDGVRKAIERGNAYREAGADCIFVPDMENLKQQEISVLVNEIDAPVNIIAGVNTPTIAELREIGVARVSLGPRPMRATLGLLRKLAREIIKHGSYEVMMDTPITYAEVNRWFADTQ